MTGCAPECDLRPVPFDARTLWRCGLRCPSAKGKQRKGEISSSYAGINRIKFIGFAGKSTVFCRQTASISVHQHTPEQARV